MKRIPHEKFSKSRWNSEVRSKNNPLHHILTNNGLFIPNNNEKQSQTEANKRYTQQELAEIKRILSKKENDYYGILDIDKHATRDKIVSTHRQLTLRVHPDKFNAPGATEATQRLNKARTELLKKYEKQNQNNNQQTTKAFTSRSTILNQNKNEEVSDIHNKSNTISTFSASPSKKKKQASLFYKKFNYLLFAFIILIIGIIIFIIYWKKRQRLLYPSTHGNISKKSKIPPTYDSPESNDGDIINMNEDS